MKQPLPKTLPLLIAMVSLLALAGSPGVSAEPAPFPIGFEAMRRLELLPVFLPNGTQTRQFISYDPAGKNTAGYFKHYEDNGEYVFFDEIGPGCLYRQQANVFNDRTKFPHDTTRIRFYFDNETKPRIDMTFDEFFGKGGKYTPPYDPPLAYFDQRGLGGRWPRAPGMFAVLYYPLPFSQRLKITAWHPDGMKYYDKSWFQSTYLKFPAGTPVKTWAGPATDSPEVRTQFERLDRDPKQFAGGQIHSRTLTLAPGEAKTALELTGQGAISSLRVRIDPWTPETFFQTRIRITWDDQPAPAVDMALAAFVGGGGDKVDMQDDVMKASLHTLMYGFDSKSGWCHSYWPMPYWSRARIEFVNDSAKAGTNLEVEAVSIPPSTFAYSRGASGYFCAQRTVDVSPEGALASAAFRARGRGKVVGLTMYSKNYCMDGDEYTYIDGSLTPQIHGSGTEDDHNQGWGGYAIQMPYWGGMLNGYMGAYRLYIPDPYIFDSSIEIAYEHSNQWKRPNRDQITDFVVWYYRDEPGIANLRLTDEIDIGQAASEKAHRYRIRGETWTGTTSSCYDRMEFQSPEPTTTDDGRAFKGSSRFTVKIDPANEGVKIRRRINRNRSNVQRTDVYVDGRKIDGVPWYVCDLPAGPEAAFRDTDYEIPAAFTKGKKRITIELRHVTAQADDSTNEYRYWIYSYGRTPIRP